MKKANMYLGIGLCAVALALMPAATLAHQTSATGSLSSQLLTGNACREDAPLVGGGCGTSADMSGTFTSEGPSIFVDIGDINPGGNNQGGFQGEVAGTPVNLFPAGYQASFGALCDAEIVDGAGVLDESQVEGNDGGSDETGGADVAGVFGDWGLVPDGTFDDGGTGGVCHTALHYGNDCEGALEPPCNIEDFWDTDNCASGSVVHAKDAVSLGNVWLAVTCDSKSAGTTLAGCSINSVLGSPTNPVNIANKILLNADSCVNTFLNVVTLPSLPTRINEAIGCVTGEPEDPVAKVGCIQVALTGSNIETGCRSGGGGGEPVVYGFGAAGVTIPPVTGCAAGVPHILHPHPSAIAFAMSHADPELDDLVEGDEAPGCPNCEQNPNGGTFPVVGGWIDI